MWTGFEPKDIEIDRAEAVEWPSEHSLFQAFATEVPAGGVRVHLEVEYDGRVGYSTVIVDLHTGEEIDIPEDDVRMELGATDVPLGLPELLITLPRGWPDGPAAAVGGMELLHLGDARARLYILDEDGTWQVAAPACQLATARAFTAEDTVWLASSESSMVSWVPVGQPPR